MAPSTPAGSVVSSTPAVPISLYLVGDVSAVAGPIPMGVSTKSVESVLTLNLVVFDFEMGQILR